MVQLPDDVKNVGYRQSKTNRFEHEQVFYSESCNFTGTEQEFIEAGHGYTYAQLDAFTRGVV